MDDATCRRVQAAMDVGVREPSEVIEDEMALVEDVRRASHIEVPPAVFELIDAHLDALRDCGRCVSSSGPSKGAKASTFFAMRRAGSTSLIWTRQTCRRGRRRPVVRSPSSCFSRALVKRTRPAGSAAVSCDCSRTARRLLTSCRAAGCSWPFPPKRFTRCCLFSTVIEIRWSTGSREPLFSPRRAGASAPASQPLRRLKPALYTDTKSALTAWSGWSTASPRSPRPARAVTSSRARARAARLDDGRRRSRGCLAHRALARPVRS